MKVTFVIPPSFFHSQPAERSAGCTRVVYPVPNIYELTVAAVVESITGCEVCYWDFASNGCNLEEFEQKIADDDSDVYLFWSVNLSIETDLKALSLIRKYHSSRWVVFEGPAPTYFAHRFLPDPYCLVVRGEPEMTIKEWLGTLLNGAEWQGIDGISYLDAGQVQTNRPRSLMKDLDQLPFPARHLIEKKVYFNPKLKTAPYTTMVTSRNCPYRCIYCVPSSLTFAREIEYRNENQKKPPISFRSIESIDRELKELYDSGYKAIGFMDDNFIWTEERTLAICDLMNKYGFKWGCQARVDAINDRIAQSLANSDCCYVDLGVESFDDEILRFINKGIASEQIYEAIGRLKKYGVPVKLNILIGTSPLETKETLKHTVKEVKRLNVDQVMFNIVSPFPGTEFYEMAKQNGWIEGDDYRPTDVQRESILNYPHLSAREMEKLLFRSNMIYFLSPYFVLTQLSRFSSFTQFKGALSALLVKLFGRK